MNQILFSEAIDEPNNHKDKKLDTIDFNSYKKQINQKFFKENVNSISEEKTPKSTTETNQKLEQKTENLADYKLNNCDIKKYEVKTFKKHYKNGTSKLDALNDEIIMTQDSLQQTKLCNTSQLQNKKEQKNDFIDDIEIDELEDEIENKEIPIRIKTMNKILLKSNTEIINKELESVNITVPLNDAIEVQKQKLGIKQEKDDPKNINNIIKKQLSFKLKQNTGKEYKKVHTKTLLQREKNRDYRIKLAE